MVYDLFISYATKDAASAKAICQALEARGLVCWISPRDIVPGTDYSTALAQAIPSCCLFLLLLSRHSNESPWVHRELERAISRGKPVLTVRLEKVAPNEHLELFISSSQWFDAFGLRPSSYLPDLGDKIRLLLGPSRDGGVAAAPAVEGKLPRPAPPAGEVQQGGAAVDPKPQLQVSDAGAVKVRSGTDAHSPTAPMAPLRRRSVLLAAVGVLLVLAVGGVAFLGMVVRPAPGEQPSPAQSGEPQGPSPEQTITKFQEAEKSFADTIANGTCSPTSDEYQALETSAGKAPVSEEGWMRRDMNNLLTECEKETGGP